MDENANEPDGGPQPPAPEPVPRPPEQEPPAEAVTLPRTEYEELMTLARERDDYLRRMQRAVADYQNLQKRVERFREMARADMVRSLAEEVLPVADSLALALEAARRTEGAADIVHGLELTEKAFFAALERLGIRPLDAVGQRFDPHFHEAAFQEPVAGVPPNTVIREMKRGFMLGDHVIRPSQVVVAAGGPQEGSPQDDPEEPN